MQGSCTRCCWPCFCRRHMLSNCGSSDTLHQRYSGTSFAIRSFSYQSPNLKKIYYPNLCGGLSPHTDQRTPYQFEHCARYTLHNHSIVSLWHCVARSVSREPWCEGGEGRGGEPWLARGRGGGRGVSSSEARQSHHPADHRKD